MRTRLVFIAPLFLAATTLLAQPRVPDARVAAARAFVELVTAGRCDEATVDFDSTMRAALPPAKLCEVWRQVLGEESFGGFDTVRGVHTGEFDIVYVRLRVGKNLIDAKVVYHGSDRIAGFFFVPVRPSDTYKPPAYGDSSRFSERLITVGKSPFLLHGRLTVPKGDGPFPCVVLVHGSGPQDMDESIGPNKPFKDLAWGLASRGIAVLRYEKRTHEHSARMFPMKDTLTAYSETIDDAVAAIDVARGARSIDPARVFLVGHSLGATLAPRIATIEKHCAGVIMLAPMARPFEDVILDQVTYLLSLGKSNDSTKSQLAQLRAQVATAKSPSLNPSTSSASLPLGVNANYWLDFRAHNQVREAQALAIPMLIIHGGRDYQVTGADMALWKKGLSGHDNVKIVEYKNLNHLFAPGTKKATPQEYEKPSHIDKRVIDEIVGWVNR